MDDIWKSAEEALMSGDAERLERILNEHGALLRSGPTQSSWAGGLTPDYSPADARAIIVRNHFFQDWEQYAAHAATLQDSASVETEFEAAVDAVVSGDVASLRRLLRQVPELVRVRSARTHHSTLLHYVGANGVEGFRQRTPRNAVEIAETLLDAGADVDASADMYGGGQTTLGLVATSIHPKLAGVQNALLDALLSRGARLVPQGPPDRPYPLVNSCLANGRPEAALFLVSRGAPLDLEGAAGIGRLDIVRSFFDTDGRLMPNASAAQMRDGFSWACEYGRTEVAEFLLERGMEIGALLRPHGQTGLHWAAYGGHVETVTALLSRRAPVDIVDQTFNGTPLEWVLHGWRSRPKDSPEDPYCEVAERLVGAGAPIDPEWFDDERAQKYPRMIAALRKHPSR